MTARQQSLPLLARGLAKRDIPKAVSWVAKANLRSGGRGGRGAASAKGAGGRQESRTRPKPRPLPPLPPNHLRGWMALNGADMSRQSHPPWPESHCKGDSPRLSSPRPPITDGGEGGGRSLSGCSPVKAAGPRPQAPHPLSPNGAPMAGGGGADLTASQGGPASLSDASAPAHLTLPTLKGLY